MELIPESVKTNLNEYEWFILLCSAWLHDVGMMKKNIEESDEDIRETHHERCAEVIKEKFGELLSGPESMTIIDVCRGHRVIDLSTLDEERTLRHKDLGNLKVRTRFLAALIRLSDACDICLTRTSPALDVSALPENAKFYHSIHERVSGLSFAHDKAAIEVSMFANNDYDKTILEAYVTDKLRSELGSISEILAENGVYYFFIRSTFSPSSVPLPEIRVPEETIKEARSKLIEEIRTLSTTNLTSALESVRKLRILGGKIPLNIVQEISEMFESKNDYKSSLKITEVALESDPNNAYLLTHVGHVKGEIFFDYDGSVEAFKRAYEISPDASRSLNYAESLVTVSEFQKAYDLASQVHETASETRYLYNANLIRIWALIFMRKKEGSDLIRMLAKTLPKKFREQNVGWRYDKISKYIRESDLKQPVKKMLLDLINVVSEGTISIEEFSRAHLSSRT